MNNRRSYGYQEKQGEGRISQISIEHREKENDYQIFLKIKCNFKKFSKMEKLVKITIAFTS